MKKMVTEETKTVIHVKIWSSKKKRVIFDLYKEDGTAACTDLTTREAAVLGAWLIETAVKSEEGES